MYYPFMFKKDIELAKKLQNNQENIDEICTYISGYQPCFTQWVYNFLHTLLCFENSQFDQQYRQ